MPVGNDKDHQVPNLLPGVSNEHIGRHPDDTLPKLLRYSQQLRISPVRTIYAIHRYIMFVLYSLVGRPSASALGMICAGSSPDMSLLFLREKGSKKVLEFPE